MYQLACSRIYKDFNVSVSMLVFQRGDRGSNMAGR